MSLYQKASLVQIPSGYKASSANLYSVVPNNGDGDFTVSVDAKATRVNKDGLIESVSANQARLNYDTTNPQDPHLLLEPSRTNYALNSNDASQWVNVGGSQSITKTANYSTAPDGTQTAARLQATATGSNYSLISLSTTSFTGNYTGSVYLKSNTGSNENVVIYGRNTIVTSYSIGNEWQRIDLQGSGTSGQNLYLFLGAFPNNGSDESIDVLVWGGQLEAGNYATSLIPTSVFVETRTKDRCTGGGDDNLFNDSEGVLFLDIQALADVDASNRYITLSDGSATNSVMVQYRNSGDLRLYNGGTGSANLILSIAADLTERKKIAIQYGTNENDYKVYINGVSQTISGSFSATSMIGLDRFRFDYVTDALEFFGKVYQAMVFNEALTNAELQTLTS